MANILQRKARVYKAFKTGSQPIALSSTPKEKVCKSRYISSTMSSREVQSLQFDLREEELEIVQLVMRDTR